MGISLNPCHFLVHTGAALGRTLTLGRQANNFEGDEVLLRRVFRSAGRDADVTAILADRTADTLLFALGATEIHAMDVSNYEGAGFIHDLNEPIPSDWADQFDTVIDGGTLEHVYHLPNALENVARLIRVGGRFLGISPANNWLGHGFYQFSPELMWRFCEGFGFQVNRIECCARDGFPTPQAVPDPNRIRQRLEMTTSASKIDLMTDATKVREQYPQRLYQSDYVNRWNAVEPEGSPRLVTR